MTTDVDIPKESQDQLDECFKTVIADRNKVAAFYDVRMVFASYCEVTSGLAAAMIKNKIYTQSAIAHLLADLLADALTRDCKTECQYISGKDAIVGGKQ